MTLQRAASSLLRLPNGLDANSARRVGAADSAEKGAGRGLWGDTLNAWIASGGFCFFPSTLPQKPATMTEKTATCPFRNPRELE